MENNRKRVVLIGTQGYGKTTLFNRLTGAKIQTYCGNSSTTTNIVLGFSQAESPKKSFEVLDTPGLGSIEDKMEHIAGILAALKQNVVHRIIFTIRHERTDLMVHQIRSMFKFFKNYKENITIYISFFDFCQGDVNKEKQQIQTRIQNEFNINSFIFYEKQSDATIVKQINQILVTSKPMHIQFSIEQIIECFDVFDLSENQFLIDAGSLIQNYCKSVQPIMKFLQNFPEQINDPLYLNYLDALQDFTINKAEEQLKKFIINYGEQMNNSFEVNSNNSQYAPYIKFYSYLKQEFSMIIQKINEKKKSHPDFIGNQIKACPYCGFLWVKEYNCNKILCGERVNQFNPSQRLKPVVKFEYKIENNQLKLILNDIQLFKDKDELINKLKDSFNNKQFESIKKQFKIIFNFQFIELLEKEFGKSCFDKWFQMIDKRNYNEFAQTLTELLIQSSQQPKEGTKGMFGCGNYFYWESEFWGIFYQKAKPLTQQQIQELIDYDLFTIQQSDQFKWQKRWEERLNCEIGKQLREMKVISPISETKTGQQKQ